MKAQQCSVMDIVQVRQGTHTWKPYQTDNGTVLPAKSDSNVMFCLQSYQGFIIDRSLVY